jgi:hypothetical protein
MEKTKSLKEQEKINSHHQWISASSCLMAILLAAGLAGTGCSEGVADQLADAQECLDAYSRNGGGDLNVCENYVADLSTPAAFGIRCATGFIREGFTSAQTYINAFNQMSTINSTTVRDFLRLISFDSVPGGNSVAVNANYTNAQKVYSACASSLAKGATLISTFSFITNVLFKYACDQASECDMDNDALVYAIPAVAVGGTSAANSAKADLGTIVVNTHTVSCSTGASNQTLCKFMSTAIQNAGGPSNKTEVGRRFLEVLASPPP